jgi:hypothetical protein
LRFPCIWSRNYGCWRIGSGGEVNPIRDDERIRFVSGRATLVKITEACQRLGRHRFEPLQGRAGCIRVAATNARNASASSTRC